MLFIATKLCGIDDHFYEWFNSFSTLNRALLTEGNSVAVRLPDRWASVIDTVKETSIISTFSIDAFTYTNIELFVMHWLCPNESVLPSEQFKVISLTTPGQRVAFWRLAIRSSY